MKKDLIIVCLCLIILFSLTILGYCELQNEGCTCSNDTPALSEAIKSEMQEIFDSESGFAADGISFVKNLPKKTDIVNVVSSGDITLNEETPISSPPTTSEPRWRRRAIPFGDKKPKLRIDPSGDNYEDGNR